MAQSECCVTTCVLYVRNAASGAMTMAVRNYNIHTHARSLAPKHTHTQTVTALLWIVVIVFHDDDDDNIVCTNVCFFLFLSYVLKLGARGDGTRSWL